MFIFFGKNSFATIEENKHWMIEYADWTLYFDMICAAAVLFQVIHDWAAKSITPNIPGKLHSDCSFGVNIEQVFFNMAQLPFSANIVVLVVRVVFFPFKFYFFRTDKKVFF